MDKPTDGKTILGKILASSTFLNKEVQKNLLVFLYSAAQEGRKLKEVDIAFDFFRRENSFLPGEDTIVRVNVYKLRVLLEKYYQNEGAKDELVVELPKGSYSLKLINRGTKRARKVKPDKRKILLLAVLTGSFALNILLIIQGLKLTGSAPNPVWDDYFRSRQPVYILLGNPFFFRATLNDTHQSLVIRDLTVNKPEEIHSERVAHFFDSTVQVDELDYPYLTSNNVRPLPDLIAFFAKADIETRVQTLSETPIEEIKRNNQIFIGNINSFGYFTKFLEGTSISLRTNPREIIVDRKTDSLVLRVPEQVKGYYIDYAFMVKLPGLNNTLLTLMGDFHASGVKGLAHFITDPQSTDDLKQNISEQYGHFPEFFEMVVKVTSYNYIDFKTEILYFNPIDSK